MERNYQASTFEDAFAMVKRDLGGDAVIVSSRHVATDGRGTPARVEVRAHAGAETSRGRNGEPTRVGAGFGAFERRLRSVGVPPGTAGSLARRVEQLAQARTVAGSDETGSLATALREELMFAGDPVADGPRVLALVGPTGVGKTTTVAKLAAVASLVRGRRVGLVSIDQYRVGGIAQLESYADLIGVPLEVASDASTLRAALHRLARAELVLVDTTGRPPKATAAITAMAECLHGAGERVEIHLCLPLSLRDADVDAVVERHAVLEPTRLVLTKVDEATDHGPAVRIQSRAGLPFSYFCTGQRVPEDVEVASPERLASLLIGREMAR